MENNVELDNLLKILLKIQILQEVKLRINQMNL